MSSSENAPCSNSGQAGSTRKEKKKQAKEERDRLKQVEKKKRRLEKALATATAIRIELEKKKQRRKEEEQRLDEEGAALAEAVALQVLAEEESTPEASGTSSEVKSLDEPNEHHKDSISSVNSKYEEVKIKLMISNSGIHSSPKDSGICSTERSKAAEIAAGVAAAQAVAALRIAEEARAEAEAAKKAAEAAISQILDRRYFAVTEAKQQHVTFYSPNIEAERDALKAQLEETERRLKEKTRQVFHLEQSLDDMTQYLLRLKSNLSLQNNVSENERELSERGSTNLAESFHGTNS